MEVLFKSRKLGNSIKKLTDKAKNKDLNLESLSVYGVTKDIGVVVTGKEVGKNLGEYYYFSGQKIAYNPYRANIGSIGLTESDFVGLMSPAYVIFEVDNTIYPEFLVFYLKSNIGQNLVRWYGDRGGIRSSLRISDLEKIDFPDITYEEQKDFYNDYLDRKLKIDKLLNEVKLQEKFLENLRQSIVQNAIKGNLTEKWRRANPSLDSGTELLNKIRISKEKLIKEKVLKVEKSIAQITSEEIPFNISKSWIWCRLDDIVSINGGITKGKQSKGEMLSVPYLRAANVQRGYLDLNEVKEILVSKSDYIKYQLEKDDVLIVEGGDRDKVGRGATWSEEVAGCIYQNHIFRLRPFDRLLIIEEYINIVINSALGRKYFEKNAKQTTNLASINKTVVRSFIYPLPGLKEQEAIVQKVKNFSIMIEKIESEIENVKNKADELLKTFFIRLLGEEYVNMEKFEIKRKEISFFQREIKYNSKDTLMELTDLLKKHGKLHAEDLWKMSKHFDNKNIGDSIDKFYADLKKKIEVEKTIREVEKEKGYIQLV